MFVENCIRCGASVKYSLLCSKCEAHDRKLGRLDNLMFKKGFAHIRTGCQRCHETSVYMNDQQTIFCPICSIEVEPTSLKGEQKCLDCNQVFEVNFATGGQECANQKCRSKNLGETPLELAKKSVPERMAAKRLEPKEKSGFIGIVSLIGFLISRLFVTPFGLALLAVSALVFWMYSSTTSPGQVDTVEEAIAVCQVNVKNQLRDPGSATFSRSTAQKTSAGWISTGIVRATNGFGALDARTYVCAITSEGVEVAIR